MKSHARKQAARAMTQAELLNLPTAFPLDVANRALNLGRTTGYDLAKRGEYPVRVLRLGNAYRVARADLLRLLGIQDSTVSESA